MSWPFAVFAIFAILIVSPILFLIYVYRKEYAREEKIVEQLTQAQLKLEKEFGGMPVYILPPEKPKKAAAQTEPTKSAKLPKKDLN
jgi:hypothetical protein